MLIVNQRRRCLEALALLEAFVAFVSGVLAFVGAWDLFIAFVPDTAAFRFALMVSGILLLVCMGAMYDREELDKSYLDERLERGARQLQPQSCTQLTSSDPHSGLVPYFKAPRFDASRFAHAVIVVLATVAAWVGIWELIDSYMAFLIPWPCSLSPLAWHTATLNQNSSSGSGSHQWERAELHRHRDLAELRRCYACYKTKHLSYPPCLTLKATFIVVGIAGLFYTRALYKNPKAAPRMTRSTTYS